jgi:hypothetical protein
MPREPSDPYAPPPRHKERSGAVVRFAIIAALLGAAAWGYMEYAQQPQTALVEPAQEQTLADTSYDTAQPAQPANAPAPTTSEPNLSEPASAPPEEPPA